MYFYILYYYNIIPNIISYIDMNTTTEIEIDEIMLSLKLKDIINNGSDEDLIDYIYKYPKYVDIPLNKRNGNNALHICCLENKITKVNILLEYGNGIEPMATDFKGLSALYKAVSMDNHIIVDMLLDHLSYNYVSQNNCNNEMNVLHYAVMESKENSIVVIIRKYPKLKYETTSVQSGNYTPYRLAMKYNKFQDNDYLLELLDTHDLLYYEGDGQWV